MAKIFLTTFEKSSQNNKEKEKNETQFLSLMQIRDISISKT